MASFGTKQFAFSKQANEQDEKPRQTLIVPDFWTSQAHSTIATQTGVVPFEPFAWQRRLIDGDGNGRTDWEHLSAENVGEYYPGVTRKEMVLKSRDVGSSEIWVRWFTWLLLRFGGNFLIKADKEDNGTNLVKMARQYLTSLPEKERPVLAADNQTEIEVEGRGTIKAIVRRGGRSERCRYLLQTERAFWQDAEEELRAVSGALVAGGWETVESTANGFNEYHSLWVGDTNGYRKTFAGRWDNPTHTDEWWQAKLSQQSTDPEGLYQEFPATDSDAFISSSRGVFDSEPVKEYLKACRPPMVTAENGALSIWVKPMPQHRYVIGADVAEGIDVGNRRLDYSCAAVYHASTLQNVATLHCRLPLDVFAQSLYDLGKYYNFAFIGVERNNHGHTVLQKLRDLGYTDLYWHHEDDFKPAEKAKTRPGQLRLGWPTTIKTKPAMESDFGAAIKAGSITSWDSRLWDECLSYVYQGDGGTGAMQGCHDDLVLAHMIALQMRLRLPPTRRGDDFVVGRFKIVEGKA